MPSPYDPRQTVKVGGSLYIKSKNTHLKDGTEPTANTIAVLQPRKMVTWLGAVPGAPKWHRVRVEGRAGVVFVSNLSVKMPDMTPRPSFCKTCDGTGAVPNPKAPANVCAFEKCRACGGNGLPGGRKITGEAFPSSGVGIKA